MKRVATAVLWVSAMTILWAVTGLSAEVEITSEPVLIAQIHQLYQYDVDAISSEPGDEIEYELREGPSGMTIDRWTGLIEWIPDETGIFEVEVRAQGESSGSGSGHDDQEYTLSVLNGEPSALGGNVRDEMGNAVGGVRLRLFEISSGHFVFRTVSDLAGRYAFPSVNPGDYFLRVAPDDTSGFARQWYDGADRIEEATTINVPEGAQVIVDVTLLPATSADRFELSGNVSDTMGVPIAAAEVKAFHVSLQGDRDPSDLNFSGLDDDDRTQTTDTSVVTDSLGNYTIVLRARTYILSASHDGFQTQFWDHKPSSLEANQLALSTDTSGINFHLTPVSGFSGAISGTIRDANTGAPIQAHVVGLHRTSPESSLSGFIITAEADQLGVYYLEQLKPGYYVVLTVPQENFVPTYYNTGGGSIDFGEAASLSVMGNLLSNIDISAEPDTIDGMNRIFGTVRADGQLLPGVLVFGIQGSAGSVRAAGVTNQQGEYALVGLAPGEYGVIAGKAGFAPESGNPVTLQYFQGMPGCAMVDFDLERIVASVTPPGGTLPGDIQLHQNFPNPFNPSTNIAFSIPATGMVTLSVHNILGQRVATLVNRRLTSGEYTVEWNSQTEGGKDAQAASSGVYFYRLEHGGEVKIGRMLLVR